MPAADSVTERKASMIEQAREQMAKSAAATKDQELAKTPHRQVFRAVTEDGEQHEAVIKPTHMAVALDHPSAINEYWAQLVAGWIALGEPGDSFMAWAETVDWMGLERQPIPPTKRAKPKR